MGKRIKWCILKWSVFEGRGQRSAEKKERAIILMKEGWDQLAGTHIVILETQDLFPMQKLLFISWIFLASSQDALQLHDWVNVSFAPYLLISLISCG